MSEENLFETENLATETPSESIPEAKETVENEPNPQDLVTMAWLNKALKNHKSEDQQEKDLKAQENERFANKVRLEQQADAMKMSKDELDSYRETLSKITNKDPLDIYEELSAVLKTKESHEVKKLEAKNNIRLANDMIIEKRWGTEGKRIIKPKISEKMESALGFDGFGFVMQNMPLAAQEEFFNTAVNKFYEKREEIENPHPKAKPFSELKEIVIENDKKE